MQNRVDILGFKFDDMSQGEVLEKIEEWVESKKPHHIVTAAVYILPILKSNKKLAEIFKKADLVVAESRGIFLLSRILGNPLKNKIGVVDFFPKILSRAEEKGWKIYLLGAEQTTVERMAQELQQKYQKIRIVGVRNGWFEKIEEKGIAREIAKAKPDLLFVGIPSPTKEEFPFDHFKEMNVPLTLGIGWLFDVYGKKANAAPPLFREHYLEGFYRLAKEPKRLWKRSTIDLAKVLVWTAQYRLKRLFGGQ